MDLIVSQKEDCGGIQPTFLSEVDAPEPVQPVVYSPVPPEGGLDEDGEIVEESEYGN
jgi:hypothetical protein